MSKTFIRRVDVLGVLVIAAVVLVVYHRALGIGFYGDDWIFYQLAGRLSLPEYLTKYFDPRAQTAWYRPVQGILFRIEYVLFDGNTVAYHWRNILLHLANCFWVWAIVQRVTRDRKFALLAAMLFATLPLGAQAVFWPGVVDPLEAFFYLASVFFWLGYLQSLRARDYAFAFIAFLLALFSKEIGVTLPVVLFLIDRCVIVPPVQAKTLMRRYFGFALVWLFYLPIEYLAISRSVFISREGYSPTLNLFSNLFDYLTALAFPWILVPTTNPIWFVVVGIGLIFLMVWQKKCFLLPMLAAAVLVILPVTPFPFVAHRFLYVASVVPAILYGALLTYFESRARVLVLVMLSSAILFGGWRIANDANDFGEWARVARVSFRNVSQAHPTFTPDTMLYFINPPVPGSNLAGMFFWRYGTQVSVGATDSGQPARLREHAVAYVYYFDSQGNQREQRVEKEIVTRAAPEPPLTFTEPIRLEGYELASTRVPRGQAFLLLLYWRARAPIAHDYTVSVRLVDVAGKIVAEYFKEPRLGTAPTSAWHVDELVVDAIQLPIPNDAAPGAYRLEVGLYDAATQQRIGIVDASGKVSAEGMILEPVRVIE